MKKKKSWIKVLIILMVLIVIVLMINSCSSQKVVVQQTVAPKDTLTVWEQKLRKNIDPKDSVRFYNSTEIKIARSFFDEFNFVEDGIIFSTDSIVDLLRTVTLKTPGLMVDMVKDRTGIINIMTVTFSRKEIIYTLNFYRKGSVKNSKAEPIDNPNIFIIGGRAVIFFRGATYKNIPIVTVGNKDCILFVDYRKKIVHIKDVDSAEGL